MGSVVQFPRRLPVEAEPELPLMFRAMLVAVNKTFGADLDALATHSLDRIAALEAQVADLTARLSAAEVSSRG